MSTCPTLLSTLPGSQEISVKTVGQRGTMATACASKQSYEAFHWPARPPIRPSIFLGHGPADPGNRFRGLCPHLLSRRSVPRAAAQSDHSPASGGIFLLASLTSDANVAGLRRPR